jgi:hypothetical protein
MIIARLDRLRPMYSAFHNARSVSGPCQSESQDVVLSHIVEWINSNDSASVLWMCSDTRAMTSSIAQSIAHWAGKEDRLLASYLFPWTDKDEGRDHVNLLPTIMYQVALSDKAYLQRIATAINYDRDIHD